MMAMSLYETDDGRYKVVFESVERFENMRDCIEFGKSVFRILEDMEEDELVNVQLIVNEEENMYMELRTPFEEL